MTALLSLVFLCLQVSAETADAPCRPFRVHMQAELPSAPSQLALKACISHYENMDLDQDGISDWTSEVDGRSGSILYPRDADLDGDGIENVLDPQPLTSTSASVSSVLPAHLKMSGEREALQAKLYEKHKIIAIDHTDQHSVEVLQSLLTLLEEGIPRATREKLTSVKYIYAFKGHDPVVNIAGYHRHMNAISIGGKSAYGPNALSNTMRVAIMASLAHETGHAFLFDMMTPQELVTIGKRHSSWDQEVNESNVLSFFDQSLFQSHPLKRAAKNLRKKIQRNSVSDQKSIWQETILQETIWKENNLTSEYATKNLHEWFADAFAAGILNRLGEKGILGSEWKSLLAQAPQHHNGYWVNYNNISSDFREWLDQRLEPTPMLRRPSSSPNHHRK